MEYVKVLEALHIPIELIHFNDSKLPFNAHRDRHAGLPQVYMNPLSGQLEVQSYGFIGVDELYCFLNWAVSRGIPLVNE